MNQIAINLMLTKPGVELALFALTKLPYEQSAGLIREIEARPMLSLKIFASSRKPNTFLKPPRRLIYDIPHLRS